MMWYMTLVVLLLSIIHAIIRRLDDGTTIFPDSRRYLEMGRGIKQTLPFQHRSLLPQICEDSLKNWNIATLTSTTLLPLFTTLYLISVHNLPTLQAAFGGLLVLGLSGVFRFNIAAPVMTDSWMISLSLLSSILIDSGDILIVVGMLGVVYATLCKESAPIYIALLSWNPLPLTILILPLIQSRIYLTDDKYSLKNRLSTGIRFHKDIWFSTQAMILPWGICLLALFGDITPQLLLLLIYCYSMLFIATDTLRLYQLAFPVVIAAAVPVIPVAWYAPLLIAQWFNPWQSPHHKGSLLV